MDIDKKCDKNKCEINSCPRNSLSTCELSKLKEDDSLYVLPSKCAHRLFKLKQNDNL